MRAKNNVRKADNQWDAANNQWVAMQTASDMLMQTATEMPIKILGKVLASNGLSQNGDPST